MTKQPGVFNIPRVARQKSKTGIYHIMLRGANRKDIFHDDKDRIRYLNTMNKYKNGGAFKVYGWCLMNNHIHLLLQEGKATTADILKRIGVSFVGYYNRKYNATGHLFQDRYQSEAVEDDSYLLTVVRYIHQNPVKAGIVQRPEDWPWSSCSGYYGRNIFPPGLLDRELVLDMFSQSLHPVSTAIEWFKAFNETENDDACLDNFERVRFTDEQAKIEIEKAVSPLEIVQIKGLSKSQRDEILVKIKSINGITQRQAAKIIGVSPNQVYKAESKRIRK